MAATLVFGALEDDRSGPSGHQAFPEPEAVAGGTTASTVMY